jgi:hypothetical protein
VLHLLPFFFNEMIFIYPPYSRKNGSFIHHRKKVLSACLVHYQTMLQQHQTLAGMLSTGGYACNSHAEVMWFTFAATSCLRSGKRFVRRGLGAVWHT